MMDALVLWRDWLDRRVEMTAARQLARRVVTLARTLNERVLTGRLEGRADRHARGRTPSP